MRLIITILLVTALGWAADIQAQVYLGAGYTYVSLSSDGIDDSNGIAITIQKDFDLKNEKLHWSPRIQMGLLYGNADSKTTPSYYSVIGSAVTLGYDLVRTDKLTVAPFAGAFVSWVVGVRDGKDDGTLETALSGPIDEVRAGLDFGLAVNYAISETFSIRLVPINIQLGNGNYKDLKISLLVSL